MLKQISCNAFKIGNMSRPPIEFQMGLSTILGSVKSEAGSIGKPTMMLIIDFVFGSNNHVSSDVVRELNDHTIYFTFEFDNVEHHFTRSPHEVDNVVVVDKDRQVLESCEIKKFTSWLAERYDMDMPRAFFRNTINRFPRIYDKNNHNELKPLQMRGGEEAQKEAINILISLIEYYTSIEDFKNQLQEADARISAFRSARRYEFVPSEVDEMTKYNANVVEIAALEGEQRKPTQEDETSVEPPEVNNANERNMLSRQLNDTRRAIRTKKDELHLLDLNLQHGAYPTEADLKTLHEFLPEASFAKLVEIEKFHTKIQTIIGEELLEAKEQVEKQIIELRVVARQILTRMDSIPVSKVFIEEILDAYTSLDRHISKLKDENDAFDTRNRLQTAKKEANDRYQKQVESVLPKIKIVINTQMGAINDEVTGGQYNAPKLTLRGFNRYTFKAPRDKGTGTNRRSMIIYDLAVFQNTVLPAIAHVSIVFDSMPRPDLSNLIRVNNDQIEKQIFIAVNKTANVHKRLKRFLRRRPCFKLDNNEQVLFGEKKVSIMKIQYNKFWKILIDKNKTKYSSEKWQASAATHWPNSAKRACLSGPPDEDCGGTRVQSRRSFLDRESVIK